MKKADSKGGIPPHNTRSSIEKVISNLDIDDFVGGLTPYKSAFYFKHSLLSRFN
jgi:hypothetical protein